MYGKGFLSPENLVKLYDRFGIFYPSIAKLVFEKQRQSLQHSRSVIVPAASMRNLLLDCYPETPPERIRVLPWGHSLDSFSDEDVAIEIQRLRDQYRLHPAVPTLLCLSRISPEKGQDLLLEAIAEWQTRPGFPAHGLNVVICGEAAYMMGQRYLEKLKTMARRLKRTNVVFPGYVMGLRKRAFFKLADLYVFPSRHESYGLTLVEALAAGICRARESMRPMACSATEMALPPGVFMTRTPAAVAASRSTLSTPTPARPMTRSLGALERTSELTLTALRTSRASQSARWAA